MITRAYAKAKGYKLQHLLVDKLRKKYPILDEQDILSTPSAIRGEDVWLSATAKTLIPYSFEAKARAKMAVYEFYAQAVSNSNGREPVVVIKQDRSKPLAIIDLDHFLGLLK